MRYRSPLSMEKSIPSLPAYSSSRGSLGLRKGGAARSELSELLTQCDNIITSGAVGVDITLPVPRCLPPT